jgi:hypothetical protein
VRPIVNDQIITELSSDFIQNNFELLPLFKSEHFFNSDASNVIIKSPIDLMVFIEKEFDFIKPNNFTASAYYEICTCFGICFGHGYSVFCG